MTAGNTLESLFGRFGRQIANSAADEESNLCNHVINARAEAARNGRDAAHIALIICRYAAGCKGVKCKLDRNNQSPDWPRY